MENSPHKRAGFPIVQTLLAVVVVLILPVLVLPMMDSHNHEGISRVLSNARQIHQSAYRMVLDNAAEPNPELGWAGDLAIAKNHPVATTGDYVERMVSFKYLDRVNLHKVFSIRDVPVYPGTGPFEGKYSVYTFFKITEKDEDTAVFLATKNFHYGAALDPKAPYGERGSVIVHKAGDAQKLSAGQAMNKNVGLMPGGTVDDPGVQEGNTLKD